MEQGADQKSILWRARKGWRPPDEQDNTDNCGRIAHAALGGLADGDAPTDAKGPDAVGEVIAGSPQTDDVETQRNPGGTTIPSLYICQCISPLRVISNLSAFLGFMNSGPPIQWRIGT